MIFQIKVKVKVASLKAFGEKLMAGQLDRSAIISETYCEKSDPAVGISYWKADSLEDLEARFAAWRVFYEAVEIKEVVSAKEAMMLLFGGGKA